MDKKQLHKLFPPPGVEHTIKQRPPKPTVSGGMAAANVDDKSLHLEIEELTNRVAALEAAQSKARTKRKTKKPTN